MVRLEDASAMVPAPQRRVVLVGLPPRLGARPQRLLEGRRHEAVLQAGHGDLLARAAGVKAGGRGAGRARPRRQGVAALEEAVFEAPGEGAARRGRQALPRRLPGLQESGAGGGLGEQLGRQAPGGGATLFRRPPRRRPVSRSIRESASQCAAAAQAGGQARAAGAGGPAPLKRPPGAPASRGRGRSAPRPAPPAG